MTPQNNLDSVCSTKSESFRFVRVDVQSTDKRNELGLQGDPRGNATENRMDVEADHNSHSLPGDKEDDLLKDCHVLDVSFIGKSVKKIWTIPESSSQDSLESGRRFVVLCPLWRASEREPFIWENDKAHYLFVEEGVFEILVRSWPSLNTRLS